MKIFEISHEYCKRFYKPVVLGAVSLVIVLYACFIFNAIFQSFLYSFQNAIPVATVERAWPCDHVECFKVGKPVALVLSGISPSLLSDIKEAYAREPFEQLCFISPGGNENSAVDIGRWMRRNGVASCLAEQYRLLPSKTTSLGNKLIKPLCASVCPFVIAMAPVRFAYGDDLNVHVHRPGSFIDVCLCEISLERSEYKEALKENLLDPGHLDLVALAESHPHKGPMLPVPFVDLKTYNLFTHYR